MPAQDTLYPLEASYIATNAYFALKDWINLKPVAGVESRANLLDRVLGLGTAGIVDPKQPNPTLRGTALANAKLGNIYSATTGFGTESGFGYLLNFREGSRRHTIIATRGTRPELGAADLLTDARAAMTAFPGYGPVHKGFRTTYDSAMVNLARDHRLLMDSDVVHCVGHSLGGAVATLIAAHYAGLGKSVKLYTFGSPRVGAGGTYAAMHTAIGKDNIFRVAHDLDPISLIGPFPFIHVNPSSSDPNNFTIPSPTGSLFSTINHDMNHYIASTGGEDTDWGYLRGRASQVDHDNAVLARWLLHKDNEPGWVQYASAKTLGILLKLFQHVLRTISTSVLLSLTAIDLLAEMLFNGLHRAKAMGEQILQLLNHAAKWAGFDLAPGADFTARIIGRILSTMLAAVQQMAVGALQLATRNIKAMPLVIASGWALSGCSTF